MPNSNSTTPLYTVAAVAEWLREQQAAMDHAGIDDLTVQIDSRSMEEPALASGYASGTTDFAMGRGSELLEALAALRLKIPSGATRAAQLRLKALELLAEANKLAPVPAVVGVVFSAKQLAGAAK